MVMVDNSISANQPSQLVKSTCSRYRPFCYFCLPTLTTPNQKRKDINSNGCSLRFEPRKHPLVCQMRRPSSSHLSCGWKKSRFFCVCTIIPVNWTLFQHFVPKFLLLTGICLTLLRKLAGFKHSSTSLYASLEVTVQETEHYAKTSSCEVTPCILP